ncbi:MAG: HU-CCDC81 and SPOR domain-containing protein [Crocinitomicaceae bacterium]|nr:HU-CCDC81 and SPOR domain-containing protein [Crocinitomicaceae bacterium]
MKLQDYIAQLLHDHNCVIVPDFGGFVANYKSAVIDNHHSKIHPPSKSVLFNPHLINNDGLLGNHIAQKKSLSYPDALGFINDEVNSWKNGLAQGERIEIGELGFLYRENDTVHFEQSREVNLLLQAYGLRSINFVRFDSSVKQQPVREVSKIEKPTVIAAPQNEAIAKEPIETVTKVETEVAPVTTSIDKEVEEKETPSVIALNSEEAIEEVQEEKEYSDDSLPEKRHIGFTILRYTAAAAVVPVLFYSYWIPMETDALETSSIQLVDFNPIHTQHEKQYNKRDATFAAEEIESPKNWEELTENINAAVYNFELTEDFFVPILLSNGTGEPIIDEVESSSVISGNYHVISGCFSVKSNAENKVKELKKDGYNAAVLDKSKGLHRVTSGGYATRDQAEKALDELRNSGHSGWILKK